MGTGDDMKDEFTNNALARMLDRGIPEADIRAALTAPDQLDQSVERRWCVRKKVSARTLEVIFSRQRAGTQVITAYWQEPSA
jgi:hypothetical protein